MIADRDTRAASGKYDATVAFWSHLGPSARRVAENTDRKDCRHR